MIDRPATLVFLILTLLLALGCGGAESPASGAAPALPEGIAPISSQEAPPPLGDAVTAVGIRYQMPQTWQPQAPSSMRIGQAVIPAPAEGEGDGELAVFFFGVGGGGGVEANLQRWTGQMELAAEPRRQSFALEGGLQVTWLEASGTLKASTMGTGPTTDQAGYRLFGAVVQGPGGPWFFKATGPDATLAAHRGGFLAMLRSIRPAGANA